MDRLHVATNPASRWLADLLVSTGQEYGVGLRVEVLEDEAAVQSDHAPFWARGYDAVLAIENYLPNDPDHPAVHAGLYRVNDTYHTVRDVPDSLNFNLVAKVARLAVAALGQYAQGDGRPDPAVFTGDVQQAGEGRLRCHVGNIGTGPLAPGAFTVRLSHCGADSTACEPLVEERSTRSLLAGQATTFEVTWSQLGDAVFLLEVVPAAGVDEVTAVNDRAFQRLHVLPVDRIAVYPNPCPPGVGRVIFAGLPHRALVRLFSATGELVWSAREDDALQRVRGTHANEVQWPVTNHADLLVGSGVYLYTITGEDGHLLAQSRVAVVR